MKKTMKKILALGSGAVLLVSASVMGTMAYLTSQDQVTNTFTVGKVEITLDEADVKLDGTYEKGHGVRVAANKYHLLPGHTYIKDPTVTVKKNSEDAYVRMIVTVKGIDDLKAALPTKETFADEDGNETTVDYPENQKYYGTDGTFLLQMLCVDESGECTWDENAWVASGYSENDEGTEGYYEFRYVGNDNESKGIVVKSKDDKTVLPDLFETITVPSEIDNDHLAYLANVEIVVEAHAIQADGFDSAEEAWETWE